MRDKPEGYVDPDLREKILKIVESSVSNTMRKVGPKMRRDIRRALRGKHSRGAGK